MMQPRHILICGERGIGKSTLIQKLLAHSARPVYGFVTKRLAADETGFHPVYIHPAGASERVHDAENRIGVCNSKEREVALEVFNSLGVQYISETRPDGVIVMDELGFMEARAEAFVQAVFRALDGRIPAIAAVKDRFDVPFLNEVRAHPNARVYRIDGENRDALFEELLPVVIGWNTENGCL